MMNYTLKIASTLTLLLLSHSVCSQQEIHTKETYKRIDSLFKSYHQENETGSVLSIIKNGETIYTNHIGLANVEHQLPITNATTFNIASVSKQFTTFLALMLEEEGKLSFNDDIRKYIAEFTHLPNRITIKQLTNHTHGLPNADELAQLKGIKTMHHKQVLKMLLSSKQVNFKPGDKHVYNNTGYIVLSEIIKRVGQKPFKEQLQEKIFKPLGMNHTQAYGYNDDVIQNKAYSYRLWGNNFINFPVRLATMGSSGIYTTISDLEKWAKNYQKVTVGKEAFYNKMQTATFLNSGEKIKYGLGFQFDNYKGVDVVFHGGGTEGYRSYILHAPKYQLSLVFLSNKGDMSGLDILYKSLEIILKESIEEKPNYKKLNSTELKNLEGTYEIFPGIYYNIIAENDTLYFQDFESTDKYHLPQIGENKFDFPTPHFKFVFYNSGFNYHMADMIYPCTKTNIKSLNLRGINLNDFTGTYKNTEHNTSYELIVEGNKLIARHSLNNDIILHPLAKNSFYSREAFFAKVDFIFYSDNTIKGFKVSGQNLNNIVFNKNN